jgi:hypothetical protein
MKYDPLKSFGYPVLRPLMQGESPDQADYPRTSFQPSFSFGIDRNDPGNFNVSYDFTGLSLKALKEAVEAGSAKYVVRIECKATYFAVTHEVGVEGDLQIEGNKLRDWVDLSGYIVANGDCKISSKQINEEFGFTDFTALDGSILAWSQPTTYSVEKDFYKNIRSIFEYREDESIHIGKFFINLDEDYVFIHAHPTQIRFLRGAETTDKARILLLNAVVFPVVLQMAIKLKEDPDDALSKRWGNIFAAKCAANKIDYSGDPNLTAQSLLARPLKMLNDKFLVD